MSPGEKLLWDMKVTAGARFNASARLAAADRFANISIAIYSSIVVSTSLIAVAFDLDSFWSKVVSVATLVASIVILVLSMKLYADRHAVESEQMHRCALEINELRREGLATTIQSNFDIKEYTARYNVVLQKYSLNHSEKDYLKYKFSHAWEFEDLRDLDKKATLASKPSELWTVGFVEKLTGLAGAAGLAAAISGLLAALFAW